MCAGTMSHKSNRVVFSFSRAFPINMAEYSLKSWELKQSSSNTLFSLSMLASARVPASELRVSSAFLFLDCSKSCFCFSSAAKSWDLRMESFRSEGLVPSACDIMTMCSSRNSSMLWSLNSWRVVDRQILTKQDPAHNPSASGAASLHPMRTSFSSFFGSCSNEFFHPAASRTEGGHGGVKQ